MMLGLDSTSAAPGAWDRGDARVVTNLERDVSQRRVRNAMFLSCQCAGMWEVNADEGEVKPGRDCGFLAPRK